MGMVATTIRAAWLHALNKPCAALGLFWRAVKAILYAFYRAFRKCDRSSQQDARKHACLHCPIFDRKWNACGDGIRRTKDGKFVGCLCYMPFKVTLPTATCWLHDQGVTDEGWPNESQSQATHWTRFWFQGSGCYVCPTCNGWGRNTSGGSIVILCDKCEGTGFENIEDSKMPKK